MAGVAAGFESVVELTHALRRLDVDRVLRLDDLGAVTGDKGEMLDVLMQIGQPELDFGVFFQIVEAESLEVGYQDVSR